MTASSGKSEFDERRGFAAVDAFFNKSNHDGKSSSAPLLVNPPAIAAIQKNARLGVGASHVVSTNSSISKVSIPQEGKILKIGFTRRRKRQGFDDNEDEVVEPHADDDSDDDDKGRTAIVDDKNTFINSVDTSTLSTSTLEPQKKRKKGKKERKLQGTPATPTLPSVDTTKSTNENPQPNLTEEVDRSETTLEEPQKTAPRKRRKKVRSKQKNIRKDHRDVKPVHVMEQGRPLTAATRAILQAPKIIH